MDTSGDITCYFAEDAKSMGSVRSCQAIWGLLVVVCAGVMVLVSGGASRATMIVNGDFEAGNTGFSSGYSYSSDGLWGTQSYGIRTSPYQAHSSWRDFGDHTTGHGLMMLVNGSEYVGHIWKQTVAVTPNTNYEFSVWVKNSYQRDYSLQSQVDNVDVGGVFTPISDEWELYKAVWSSGAKTTAEFSIVSLGTSYGGNDYALDDIQLTSEASVPEIDPAGMGSVLALVTGGLALIERRRLKVS